MNAIRNLIVLTVVLTLTLALFAPVAFADRNINAVDPLTRYTGVPDNSSLVIGPNQTDVILLMGALDSLVAGDSLSAVAVKACIESEFAVSKLYVKVKSGSDGTISTLATKTLTSVFEEDSLIYFTGLHFPVADGDTLMLSVDVWTDSVLANAADYNGTGLDLAILPDGVDIVRNDSTASLSNRVGGSLGTGGYLHNPGWDPLNCESAGEAYTAILDLEPPDLTFTGGIYDMTNCNARTTFNIGDSLLVNVTNSSGDLDSNSLRADLSAFDMGSNVTLLTRESGPAVDTSFVIDPGTLDIIYPFSIGLTAADTLGNSTSLTYVFNTQYIDNIAPEIDSVKFAIYANHTGPADGAAIGDELVLWVYTGSSGFFEVDDVVADISRFVPGATAENMTDVTTGAGVWRLIFELTDPIPVDLPSGADTAKVAIVTAVDNGCNTAVDTVDFLPALDLEPPVASATKYQTLADNDASGCTNLGDEVRIEADLSSSDDVASVWGDLFHGGIGGASNTAFTDEGSGIWAYEKTIGSATDPAQDPPTLQAKDANSDPVDADFTIWIYFEDDAGNIDSVQTSPLRNTTYTATVPLDTRRPTAIIQDSVFVERLPGGELQLKWNKAAQAGDATNFYVYVDSTGDDINYSNVFGTTFNGEFPDPTYNYWKSGPLTDGKTYRFSIRTQDDCGNFEFNKAIFEGIPDAQAPTACVEFPTTGGNYGPNNPLTITAISSDVDIDAAYAVYRLKDQGDGNPGPWINYPISTPMTKNGLTFTQTINLGSAPSTEGTYELRIIGVDEVGNELSLDDALANCGTFEFTWNPNALVCDVLTINGAGAPQTTCGFDVTRDDLNTAEVSIVDPDTGPYYTVDVWVLVNDVRTRIEYAKHAELPYSFMFSAVDWPKTQGTGDEALMYVTITDERSGNDCETDVNLCVPDQIAPAAMIVDPVGYSCVPIVLPAGDPIPITVQVDPNAYDNSDAVRAEFYYSLTGSTEDGVQIGVEPFDEDEATVDWDNSALSSGYVWLYAIVYDGLNNAYTTPFVKICVDGDLPQMTMSVKEGKFVSVCGGPSMWRLGPNQNDGIISIEADPVNLDAIDINDPVRLYFCDVNDPDIFYYYDQNPHYTMDYVNNNSIWVYPWQYGEDLECGHTYRVRLAVKDAAGNWMFDYDGDGNFDDYTFDDAQNNGSGMLVYYDCTAPQPAFSLYQTDGTETRTWVNPSTRLNGIGDVYALPGEDITVQLMTIPADDSCEVSRVDYYLCETFVGSSTDYQGNWQVTFNPVELGLFTPEDAQDFGGDCTLHAVMYDQVGNSASDDIDVYFLDNIPANFYITDPHDGDCVAGDVTLDGVVFDNQPIKKVVWYYWPVGGTDTTMIAEVAYNPLDKAATANGSVVGPFGAVWHTLNSVPNGQYVIAASVCDISDNYTDKTQAMITVTVANGLPTVSINSPADGGFFCEGEYFCADADPGDGCPIDNVQFQFKSSFDNEWTDFDNGPDAQAPWCATLADEEGYIDSDGWYDFRAVVTNTSGVSVASDKITLFYDGTNPRGTAVSATDGTNTWDLENSNDPGLTIPVGTKLLTFTLFAADDQSSQGTSPTFNSGISKVCLSVDESQTYDVCLDVTPDANGYFDVPWDPSGLGPGEHQLAFTVYDNACGSTTFSTYLDIEDTSAPWGMIAGCWNGYVYGMTWTGQQVLFEYTTDGTNWIPISAADQIGSASQLLLPNGSYTTKSYRVYRAAWQPADGSYQVRMHVEGGEAMPALGIDVANGTCTVTSNPEDFGPGTIERNLENGCDNLEGIGRFGSAYGMPYGIAVSYNIPDDSYDANIIQFSTLPQQGTTTQYAGAFQFWALTEGGFGWGHLFFFDSDDAGDVAYSSEAHYETYWVNRDFGTGGMVTYADGSVTVEMPPQVTDNTGTAANSLAIWKSPVVRPSVYQDWEITPIGDNNGMMTYLSDPSCNDICFDDGQYAIVDMQYDNNETTDPSKLSVGWWDGEGNWRSDNIFFPSTVRGFHQENGQNWVEFAVTCFGAEEESGDAWYSVIKRTQYDGQPLITRYSMSPDCDNYTNGYPTFWYQLDETFAGQLDFSTLEIWLDGTPIWEYASDSTSVKVGNTPAANGKKGTLLPNSIASSPQFVDVAWEETTNRVLVDFNYYGTYSSENDYADYPPLACGEHTLKVRIADQQSRPQYIEDDFMVDCQPPDVNFDNYFTAKNPVIQFSITDDASGVDWDNVHADVFFVTKANLDGTNQTPNEKVEFVQTFFPDQIKDYLQEDGQTVRIPTSYDLENRRAIIVVVFDGYYAHQISVDLYNLLEGLFDQGIGGSDPSFYSAFNYYYSTDDGVWDCVGNWATPHVQYIPVDAEAPVVDVDDSRLPVRIQVTDNGSGLDASSMQIYEDGVLVTSEAQSSAGAVDQPGEWYFETTSNGGILWYYPKGDYEVRFSDMAGNETEYTGNGGGAITGGSVTGWAGPNPYDPTMDGDMTIHYGVAQGKVTTVTCTIYDQAGSMVASLAPQSSANGSFTWGGTTNGGTRVASGVYFAVIQATGSGGSSAVVKIAVVEK